MTLAVAPVFARAQYPSAPAALARTLLDVLAATVRAHPHAPALDAGRPLTYRELAAEVDNVAARLGVAGIGVGDRVGVRMASGTADLYVAILGVLAAGAAYVPVDVDDPQERADLVFGEAGVAAVLTDSGLDVLAVPAGRGKLPGPGDDAWIIFTSGSTGTPKGVAVTHRAAAAFVDAEAQLFLTDEPLGPGDRVLAGLSVAFDASCEEMWLAWRHGACLVPAPRALVRTGVDLGPFLVERGITAVSTVPTLAALWPAEALEDVRLLIFGGEACPQELAERVAVEGREVWNTYGPTEATVVACAAPLTGEGPVRIGLPLAGWELAVVDAAGSPVAAGEQGELVIGGVGLARYLDPAKDAQKYAPLAALGWERAYRSGDVVRADAEGLVFLGRADEQVKLGGRRIELGEVDAALAALPGARGGAAAVRRTRAGNQVLVGYVAGDVNAEAASALLRDRLPSALVPLVAVIDELPTRTSGKVDRDALPWPLPVRGAVEGLLTPTEAWLAEGWSEILGVSVADPGADFFTHGGGSLTAAQLVARIRTRHPQVSVNDLYLHPTLGALATHLDALTGTTRRRCDVTPTPRRTGFLQALLILPALALVGLRWTAIAAGLVTLGLLPGPAVPWWALALAWPALFSPAGRVLVAAGGARLLLRGVRPGRHPRGGSVHVRIWAAERLAQMSGATGIAGAAWTSRYARLLGARIGDDVDLHTAPPVTGLLTIKRGAAVEPEVDLAGHWVEGDVLHVGRIRIGAGARIGARSTLMPGARIGKHADVAPGTTVRGTVRAGREAAALRLPAPPVPAAPGRRADTPSDAELARTGLTAAGGALLPTAAGGTARPSRATAPRSRAWVAAYGLTSTVLGLLPFLAAAPGLLVVAVSWWLLPLAVVASLATYALLVLVSVRLLALGLVEGRHAVHSRVGWQAWTTERLMGLARIALYPLYASLATPAWLRLLGARIGRDVEASTVLALPSMTTVADGAFLADDTMVGTYELGGGWLRIAPSRVGKQAFLGNSGMTAAGRKVPARGLVGVLSAAPRKAKKGSSWLGLPPMPLRRAVEQGDQSRTYRPATRLKLARGLVEVCRIVPVILSATLAALVLAALAGTGSWWLAALVAGPVLALAGTVAATVAVVAKWTLVGRLGATEHPLWSSFVWRNELADSFVELLAVPWLVGPATGTPVLSAWQRAMGARIGRGVWLESYWLPETDLVTLGDGATVNRGCVVQTHLFHDRIMAVDAVRLDAGATLGPNGIVLPGASVGARTTIGPGSLVTRGDAVPSDSRWIGNPIRSW
jgi:non-ribosomal peptide synthetase-like protein